MKIRWTRYNLFLVAGLALGLSCGCRSPEARHKKKTLATIELHQEANRDPASTQQVPIYRENPVMLTVTKEPFLREGNVKEAKVVDAVGGFALRIQFDRQGNWLLQQYSASTRGGHIAIFSQWTVPPDEKLNQGRWLAAPKITAQISDGSLLFTPDATREEAEEIALGLNNIAHKVQDRHDTSQ